MRTKPLHTMFTALPRRYDMINHVITVYLDKRWRWKAAQECLSTHPHRILDLCCGTGDLAVDLARLAGGGVELIGLDYSQPMLDIAARKAASAGKGDVVTFIHGDAAELPFPEGAFDCVGISFAFRNLTYKNPLAASCLAEVRRVLAEGGRFVIVETSQPGFRLIRSLFHLYLRCFVYPAGYGLSGNKGAYRYLAESASRFFTPQQVGELLLAAGFRNYSYQPLFFGAAAIYTAVR